MIGKMISTLARLTIRDTMRYPTKRRFVVGTYHNGEIERTNSALQFLMSVTGTIEPTGNFFGHAGPAGWFRAAWETTTGPGKIGNNDSVSRKIAANDGGAQHVAAHTAAYLHPSWGEGEC